MKTTLVPLFLAAGIASAAAQAADPYVSLRQEMQQAVARGNAWLKEQQKPAGHWDDAGLPAFTALALNAAVRDPSLDRSEPLPDYIEKGYQWLIDQQKEDGGIYNRGLAVYNTATAVTSLMALNRKEFEPTVVRARRHLIGHQWDVGETGEADDPNDGGIGYGSSDTHTDLSNTYLAIEAIALSKRVIDDAEYGDQPELNWEAAITFLSRCQNLEETNDQEWASDDPKNRGGFIYTPGESKAGEDELPDGRVALRSYGSMSYAGLLSFIYAQLSPTDPRVEAVKEWIGRNYTLDENPGIGAQGLFYYYQTIAKALTAANIDKLKLDDGTQVDWRQQLGNKLLTVQRPDGSWGNDNGRWMESNPVLVTAYSVLALEQLLDSMPRR